MAEPSAHLVGRDAHTRRLADALDAALAGDPRLALINGEACAGPTLRMAAGAGTTGPAD